MDENVHQNKEVSCNPLGCILVGYTRTILTSVLRRSMRDTYETVPRAFVLPVFSVRVVAIGVRQGYTTGV